MEQRFDIILKLPNQLYIEGCPVVIEAGQLLKDNNSQRIVAQLKFRSVSEETIRALKISLDAFDITGEKLVGVEGYQYLDMAVNYGMDFGSDKAIVFPDPVTRAFEISVITVVTENSMYRWDREQNEPIEAIPESVDLKDELPVELVEQFKRETTMNAQYVPGSYKDVWICTCGTANKNEICGVCKQSKTNVIKALDKDTLREHCEQRQAEEQQHKQAKEAAHAMQVAIQAEKRKQKQDHLRLVFKRSLIISFFIIFIVAVILFVTLYLMPNVIRPTLNYRTAQRLFDAGKYEDARGAFDALGKYKDSDQMADKCGYQIAINLMDNEKYDEAISAFEELDGYADSSTQIETCNAAIKDEQYKSANELMDTGNYKEALEVFRELGSYKDSTDKADECLAKNEEQTWVNKYNAALALLDSGKYLQAYNAFKALDDYNDSEAQAKKALDKYFYDGEALTLGMTETDAVQVLNSVVGQKRVRTVDSEIFVTADTIYEIAKLFQIEQLTNFQTNYSLTGNLTLRFQDGMLISVKSTLKSVDCPYVSLNSDQEKEEQLVSIMEQITGGEQSYCSYYRAWNSDLAEEDFMWNDRYLEVYNGEAGEFVLTWKNESDAVHYQPSYNNSNSNDDSNGTTEDTAERQDNGNRVGYNWLTGEVWSTD